MNVELIAGGPGRPQGEIRQALQRAAQALYQQRLTAPLEGQQGEILIGATSLELATRAQVGRDATRETLKNMVRAGELTIVGRIRPEWSSRSLSVYAPAPRRRGGTPDGAALFANLAKLWPPALVLPASPGGDE